MLDLTQPLPGITPVIASERGYSYADGDDLAALGFADYQCELGEGLLVPMWDTAGVNGAYQFRPNTPRERKGKPVKYETPEGQRNILDVHPSMRAFLSDAQTALLITEGVKKADALTSLGYVTVALSGVWNWRGTNEHDTTGPLGDFESIALKDRSVVLLFDSDARTNPNVRLALDRLAEFLRSRGAQVRLVLPPAGPYGEKQGVDDYLAAGGTVAELFAMPDNALRVDGEIFDSWDPVNLTGLGERDPLLPNLAPDLPILYPGKRHVFSGPPESLKTMISYLALLLAVRNGKRVGVLNFEMDEFDARDMFRDLGASDLEIAQIVYRSPERGPKPADTEALIDERLDVVLIDAGAGMYDIEGADDNQRIQVEAAARKWITPLWKAGVSTVVLDHEPKNGGRTVIGSERKAGQADVHLRFDSKLTLTRGGKGVVKITVEKDRSGYIRRTSPSGMEIHIESEMFGHALTYAVRSQAAGDEPFRPTGLMERVSHEVEREGGRSKTKVLDSIDSKRDHVLSAIECLVKEGYIALEEKGQSHLLHHVKPYTEHDDVFGTDEGLTKL